MSLSKNINPSLVLVQPRKTGPFITERLLTGRKESNQQNKLIGVGNSIRHKWVDKMSHDVFTLVEFEVTVNVLKFQTLFSFCSQIKCWLFEPDLEFTKCLHVLITNREDLDQTASSQAV